MCSFFFYLNYTRASLGGVSYPQMIYTWILSSILFEIVHYKDILAMSELFLKSEAAKKHLRSTQKVFYEIPDGILIT